MLYSTEPGTSGPSKTCELLCLYVSGKTMLPAVWMDDGPQGITISEATEAVNISAQIALKLNSLLSYKYQEVSGSS